MRSVLFKFMLLSLFLWSANASAEFPTISYGFVVGLEQYTYNDRSAENAGALVGGIVGLLSGEGQSNSNKALRAIGGAAVGSAIGRAAGKTERRTYTINLQNGTNKRIVMDQGRFAIGDCVAIERGRSANLRRVARAFCENDVPSYYRKKHESQADACEQAKQEVLAAQTEDAVKTAALKLQVLCQD